jgi:thiamine-phosphate pyrophosphorylase
MGHRQTMPERWLIISDQLDWASIRRLPRSSGILILRDLKGADEQRLRILARLRSLFIVRESAQTAARVHDVLELRRAMLRRTPLILVSPIYATPSHPNWHPIPRMRAATLARLAGHRAVALGGMNEQRYAKIAPLGFIAWAGISAFRT